MMRRGERLVLSKSAPLVSITYLLYKYVQIYTCQVSHYALITGVTTTPQPLVTMTDLCWFKELCISMYIVSLYWYKPVQELPCGVCTPYQRLRHAVAPHPSSSFYLSQILKHSTAYTIYYLLLYNSIWEIYEL